MSIWLPPILDVDYDVVMIENYLDINFSRPRVARYLMTIVVLSVLSQHPSLLLGQTRELGHDVNKLNIRHHTAHYELAGTVSQEKLLEYGRCLEFIHAAYEKGFGDLLDQPSTDAQRRSSKKGVPPQEVDTHDTSLFRVVILGSQQDYSEFTRAYFGQFAEHTAGMFVPSVELLLILDDGHAEQTYQVLFHEAFHQFVHRYLPAAPVWLNEGLATHFGTASATGKGLVFDRQNTSYFNIVSNVAQAKKLISLDKLVLMNRAEFYCQQRLPGLPYSQRTLAYAQAYSLTAYLVNVPRERDLLQKYIRAIALTTSPREVVQSTKTLLSKRVLDRIAPHWLAYVQQGH